MKYRLLLAVLALGFCADIRAEEQGEYPRVSFVGPGGSKNPISRDEFVLLVVEGPYISFDKIPIQDASVVEYVNKLLKDKGVSYLAVYTREGIKYGDVVHAVDILRKTAAKNIGVSLAQLPVGRDP